MNFFKYLTWIEGEIFVIKIKLNNLLEKDEGVSECVWNEIIFANIAVG